MQDQRNTLQHNTSAAIYCRISRDKTGAGLGVERQEGDCRELAQRLGVTVSHVLVDNDLSAYSGKPRPSYLSLLELMRNGQIGMVIAWHSDRLHRSMVELEEYVTASEVGGVTTHTAKAGPLDLSTPSGRLVARQLGSVARYEVEHMIERQRSAKLQAAKSGKYLGGQRPYGFEPQRTAIRESEAAVIRELAHRFTNGASYWSLAIDLNQRGILTQHGKDWNALKIRNLLIRPINAGIVDHKGVEYVAESAAILTKDEWDDLQAAISLSKRTSVHPGRTRKHVLQGYLFCGLCGKKLFHKSKQQRDGSYKTTAACGKTDSQTGRPNGCGKVSRMVEPIIDLLSDCIMARLESPELAASLATYESDTTTLRELHVRQRALEGRSVEITNDYYVSGLLNRDEFERMKSSVDLELRAVEKSIQQQTSSRVTTEAAIEFRSKWVNSGIHWQRDLLSTLGVEIVVHPRPTHEGYTYPKYKDKWRFDPELIEIKWKA